MSESLRRLRDAVSAMRECEPALPSVIANAVLKDVLALIAAELRAAEPMGSNPNLLPDGAECDLRYGIPSASELRRTAAVMEKLRAVLGSTSPEHVK